MQEAEPRYCAQSVAAFMLKWRERHPDLSTDEFCAKIGQTDKGYRDILRVRKYVTLRVADRIAIGLDSPEALHLEFMEV